MAIADSELRITAQGWPGIFLSEEEAALALAGRGLPERVFEDDRVSDDVRRHAAESAEFRRDILNSTAVSLGIARWPDGEQDRSVSVEVRQIRSWDERDGSRISGFKTSVGGRSYSMDETLLLTDALLLACRLARTARRHIEEG